MAAISHEAISLTQDCFKKGLVVKYEAGDVSVGYRKEYPKAKKGRIKFAFNKLSCVSIGCISSGYPSI